MGWSRVFLRLKQKLTLDNYVILPGQGVVTRCRSHTEKESGYYFDTHLFYSPSMKGEITCAVAIHNLLETNEAPIGSPWG